MALGSIARLELGARGCASRSFLCAFVCIQGVIDDEGVSDDLEDEEVIR